MKIKEIGGKLIDLGKISSTEYSGIYIVPGTPLIYFEDIKALVFADVHLGYEEALARGYMYVSSRRRDYVRYVGGVIVPRRQFKKLIEYLDNAFSILGERVEHVIINGDLKHAFDRLLRLERIEVDNLLKYLVEKGVEDIVVVRGNHDNYLPLILKKHGIELVKQYDVYVKGIGRVLFTHGHLDINVKGYDLVVIGHEHPSLRCFGYRKNPAFIIFESSTGGRILVLPAAGAYQSGTSISRSREEYLSPIIRKHAEIDNARIVTWNTYSRDGSFNLDNIESIINNISDVVNVVGTRLDNIIHLYLGFNNIDDALFICGL